MSHPPKIDTRPGYHQQAMHSQCVSRTHPTEPDLTGSLPSPSNVLRNHHHRQHAFRALSTMIATPSSSSIFLPLPMTWTVAGRLTKVSAL